MPVNRKGACNAMRQSRACTSQRSDGRPVFRGGVIPTVPWRAGTRAQPGHGGDPRTPEAQKLPEDARDVLSTARGVMNRRSPIAWFQRPSAFSSSTSRSRAVRSSSGIVLAASADELRDEGRVERGAPLGHAADAAAGELRRRRPDPSGGSPRLGALGEQLHRVGGSTYSRGPGRRHRGGARGSPAPREDPRRSGSAACGCPRWRRRRVLPP